MVDDSAATKSVPGHPRSSPVDKVVVEVPEGKQRCPGCGKLLGDRTVKCLDCGTQLRDPDTSIPARSRARSIGFGGVVTVFTMLLGGFGAGVLRGSDLKEGAFVGSMATVIPPLALMTFVLILDVVPFVFVAEGIESFLDSLPYIFAFGGYGAVTGILGAFLSSRDAPERDD